MSLQRLVTAYRTLNDGKSITVSLDKAANTGVTHNTQEALSFKVWPSLLHGTVVTEQNKIALPMTYAV